MSDNQDLEALAQTSGIAIVDFSKFLELASKPSHGMLRILNKAGFGHEETARWMANEFYQNLGNHACYWNDDFYLAHMFDLEAYQKRGSTIKFLENAMAGYCESWTHNGYNISEVLVPRKIWDYPAKKGYFALEHDKIRRIAEAFGVNNNDLASAARNVISWIIDPDKTKTANTLGVSNLHPAEALELAKTYLPPDAFEPILKQAQDAAQYSNVYKFLTRL